MSGSKLVESHYLMRDKTLVARLLLSGAAVEIPCVTSTTFRRVGEGYFVELEMERMGVTIIQWVEPTEVESTVRWMITQAMATQDRLERN